MGDELCVLYTGMEKLVDVYTFIVSVRLKGLDDINFFVINRIIELVLGSKVVT
jgi:hypothetical protein